MSITKELQSGNSVSVKSVVRRNKDSDLSKKRMHLLYLVSGVKEQVVLLLISEESKVLMIPTLISLSN